MGARPPETLHKKPNPEISFLPKIQSVPSEIVRLLLGAHRNPRNQGTLAKSEWFLGRRPRCNYAQLRPRGQGSGLPRPGPQGLHTGSVRGERRGRRERGHRPRAGRKIDGESNISGGFRKFFKGFRGFSGVFGGFRGFLGASGGPRRLPRGSQRSPEIFDFSTIFRFSSGPQEVSEIDVFSNTCSLIRWHRRPRRALA